MPVCGTMTAAKAQIRSDLIDKLVAIKGYLIKTSRIFMPAVHEKAVAVACDFRREACLLQVPGHPELPGTGLPQACKFHQPGCAIGRHQKFPALLLEIGRRPTRLVLIAMPAPCPARKVLERSVQRADQVFHPGGKMVRGQSAKQEVIHGMDVAWSTAPSLPMADAGLWSERAIVAWEEMNPLARHTGLFEPVGHSPERAAG